MHSSLTHCPSPCKHQWWQSAPQVTASPWCGHQAGQARLCFLREFLPKTSPLQHLGFANVRVFITDACRITVHGEAGAGREPDRCLQLVGAPGHPHVGGPRDGVGSWGHRHCLGLGTEAPGQPIYFAGMLVSKTRFCTGASAVGTLSSAGHRDLHFRVT